MDTHMAGLSKDEEVALKEETQGMMPGRDSMFSACNPRLIWSLTGLAAASGLAAGLVRGEAAHMDSVIYAASGLLFWGGIVPGMASVLTLFNENAFARKSNACMVAAALAACLGAGASITTDMGIIRADANPYQKIPVSAPGPAKDNAPQPVPL